MTSAKINRMLASVDQLPTLPTIYTKLSELLRAPDSTVQKVSQVIAEDQAMAAKVLRLVNSAFYGFPKRIGSLQRAVVILGFNEVKSLVLATGVLQMFGKFKTEHGFDMDKLWEHSIGCAVGARVVAEAAQLSNVEDVFAGGLMHDIGKVIHAVNLPKEFVNVVNDVQETGRSMIEAEQEIFGFDHAETGQALAEKWGFPAKTVDMIANHHISNGSDKLGKEVAAVHIGNTLCSALALGSGGEKHVPMANQKAWQILDLKLSQLEPIMGKIGKVFEESVSVLRS